MQAGSDVARSPFCLPIFWPRRLAQEITFAPNDPSHHAPIGRVEFEGHAAQPLIATMPGGQSDRYQHPLRIMQQTSRLLLDYSLIACFIIDQYQPLR